MPTAPNLVGLFIRPAITELTTVQKKPIMLVVTAGTTSLMKRRIILVVESGALFG